MRSRRRVALGLSVYQNIDLLRDREGIVHIDAEIPHSALYLSVIEAFVTEKLEAAAGVRQALEAYAKTHPEVMVMQDKFMEIRQAMGAPKGRTAGAKYLSAFVEDMKTSGFVADALKRSNQSATVAPPAK